METNRLVSLSNLLEQGVKVKDFELMSFVFKEQDSEIIKKSLEEFQGSIKELVNVLLDVIESKINLMGSGLHWLEMIIRIRRKDLDEEDNGHSLDRILDFYLFSEDRSQRLNSAIQLENKISNLLRDNKLIGNNEDSLGSNEKNNKYSNRAFGQPDVVVFEEDSEQEERDADSQGDVPDEYLYSGEEDLFEDRLDDSISDNFEEREDSDSDLEQKEEEFLYEDAEESLNNYQNKKQKGWENVQESLESEADQIMMEDSD